MKAIFKRKSTWMILFFVMLLSSVSLYHSKKPLPEGISYESQTYMVDNVNFLYDLSYKDTQNNTIYEQEIFQEFYQLIEEAEEFIVLDMFLFNGYADGDRKYPAISETLTTKILEQIKKKPNLQVHLIIDEINTTYNSHNLKHIEALKEQGVRVIFTDLNKLRDPNPIYSGLWRVAFKWFGQEGTGLLPNPIAKSAPEVTLRSYLKLLNIKANHRKVIATEDAAIISSANAHDASGYHSNIAFKVNGNIIGDVLNTEQAVANFSGGGILPQWNEEDHSKGKIRLQLVTEGKIEENIIDEIKSTDKGDIIWLAMFYLADTDVLEELKHAASNRGVKIKMILDPNQNAFGSEKMGLPNLPVAAELTQLAEKNIEIRWYHTGEEQFHSKLLYIEKQKEAVIIGGSANFTERNLNNYNLETNVKITASNQEEVIQEIDYYFHRLWKNENGEYTVDYKHYQDQLPVVKYILYLIQKLFHFTTY
jgi:HKD family nuclease